MQMHRSFLVGVTGFEPVTPCSQRGLVHNITAVLGPFFFKNHI